MRTIKTAILSIPMRDENVIPEKKCYKFKIEYYKRTELLRCVFDTIFNDKYKPLPYDVIITLDDKKSKVYRCCTTMLHYCYAKGRIADKKLVSMTFSRKNRIA